jgi:hypothetical protein
VTDVRDLVQQSGMKRAGKKEGDLNSKKEPTRARELTCQKGVRAMAEVPRLVREHVNI